MNLRLTHLHRYAVDGTAAADGLALAGPGDGAGPRWFVPGQLPCGECAPCRRALVGACRSARRVLDPGGTPPLALDIPDRFLTPVDEPPELAPLDARSAAAAGLVAWALQAMAVANLAPGDVAVWLGDGPLPALGAQLSSARGAATFLLSTADTPPGPGDLVRVATTEELALALCESESGADSGTGHRGRGPRRLFAAQADPPTLRAAGALAAPGSNTVLLGAGPLSLPASFALAADAALLRSSGYHPDLVPEALAALRRGDVQLPATGLDVIGG